MHRRKPISAKQRKEQLQLKRAIKRGDLPPPPPSKPDRHRKGRRGTTAQLGSGAATRTDAAESTRRLESSFVKLAPAFLERTKVLASTLPLSRPIPTELAILPDVDKGLPGPIDAQNDHLTCPRRPKWRYDMSKKEVEANEEGLFKKWLAETDATLNAWCNDVPPAAAEADDFSHTTTTNSESMPRAPSSYERNLEVWRQIWRVTEISQILLILLDSRCPTLHFPPALSGYLSTTSNASRLRTILVLTKVDISGPVRAEAWTKYLTARYPNTCIVQVESYAENHPDGQSSSSARKRMNEPHLPTAFRHTLVDALRETHAELLEPPQSVKTNPDRLASWRPRIKSEVDWDAVLKAHGGQVGTAVGGALAPKPNITASDDYAHAPEDHAEDDGTEPEVLTIGLIGQPNVGKSSLLNALFGTQKVRASRTPGKTKHFQTLFWTPEVRLVDCPGLVIPNYVPMETQVLSGILPISRVSAIPLCVHHAARLLPLERILGLTHPSHSSPPPKDKRTWREGMRPRAGTDAGPNGNSQAGALVWSAMDILTAYANKKGWVTAKAGRPDVNRAGNAILRALAEGRIRWAFWPPGTDPQTIRTHWHWEHGARADDDDDDDDSRADRAADGIWIAHDGPDDNFVDAESEEEEKENGDDDDDSGGGNCPARPREGSSDEDEEGSEADAASSENEEERDIEREHNAEEELSGKPKPKPKPKPKLKPKAKTHISATAGRFGVLVLDDSPAADDDDEYGSDDGKDDGEDDASDAGDRDLDITTAASPEPDEGPDRRRRR